MNIVETPSSWCVYTLISSSKDCLWPHSNTLQAAAPIVCSSIQCFEFDKMFTLGVYLVSLRTTGQWRKAMFTKRFSRNTLFIFFVGPNPGRKLIQWDKRKVSLDLCSFRKASKTLWTKNFFHIFVLIAGPKKVIQKVLLNQVIVIFNTIWVQRKSFTQLQKVHLISIFTQGLWKVALFTVTHY